MPEYLEITVDKFTFKIAGDRFYTTEGIWAQADKGIVKIGLSDFLQQSSGDIAFAEVKPEGTILKPGQEAATIETIKVNIEVKSPVAGAIVQANPLMETAPETINQDPYGEGWLCEIDPRNWAEDQKLLLKPAQYFALIKQEAESGSKSK